MERVSKNPFNKLLLAGGAALLALLPVSALAGVVMAPPAPPAEVPAPNEDYPESRFGRPPAKPNLGITPGFAGKAVEDLDQSGDDPTAPGIATRSPAGLESQNPVNPMNPSGPIPSPLLPMSRELGVPQVVKTLTPEPMSVARRGVQEIALIAGDLGFFPKTVFVTRDVPVRMFVTGASKNTLCIMMDTFQVRRQVRSQRIEEITFTPDLPGRFRFYCPVNGMEGTMIVKEIMSLTDDTSGVSKNGSQAAADMTNSAAPPSLSSAPPSLSSSQASALISKTLSATEPSSGAGDGTTAAPGK